MAVDAPCSTADRAWEIRWQPCGDCFGVLHVVFVVAGFIPGYERRWLAFSAVLAAWWPCCCRRPLFWLLLLLLHMVPCLPLLMPSAYCSFNFLSASSLVACCFSACAFYCRLCSCLFTLAIHLSSCCWIPLWIFALCCSLINLYKCLNKQCLAFFSSLLPSVRLLSS